MFLSLFFHRKQICIINSYSISAHSLVRYYTSIALLVCVFFMRNNRSTTTTCGKRYYVCMAHCRGDRIHSRYAVSSPLSVRNIILVRRICMLGGAHSAESGMLHMDETPGNTRLSADGTPDALKPYVIMHNTTHMLAYT